MIQLRGFRKLFWAAAVYNFIAGLFLIVFPASMLAMLGVSVSNQLWLVQCIGMMVGVFAIGYALIASEPLRFGPMVWVGIAGKSLGIVGFLVGVSCGWFSWRFGGLIVLNDVIWLPPFLWFVVSLKRVHS